MPAITTHKDGDVLVAVNDNPPVNALGAAVRQGLAAAIEEAATDPQVRALVIIGGGTTFSGGADITEFGKPPVDPHLPHLVDLIEASAKPVVAAIRGTAFGGGLEIALGAHYRVATPSARLGLPEVKLGLLPGAGGTQRLPRVIGVEAALPMMVSGDPVPAAKAHAMGLVDRIVGEDTLEADAITFAREIADAPRPVSSERRDRVEATDPGLFDQFAQHNARRIAGLDAPAAIIEATRAATDRPFADGIARERELFMGLMAGSQSKALRYAFFAQRAANKIDGLPSDVALIDVRRVGILGAGTMGGGIAMNFLSAGIDVVMLEREQAALDRGTGVMRRNFENTAKRGRLTAEQVEAAMGRLSTTLSYDDLADCDLIIEAVFEEMSVKKEVFAKLDAVAKPGAILASNTSYLNVDEIAAATGRPDHVLGLHFFSPANVMKLLEIVRGRETAPAVLATAMALARRIGKIAVVAGVCHGFIGNRMLSPRQAEAFKMILQGASYDRIDRVLTDFGFPMGPFQMSDLAGLDLGWNKEASKGETIRDVLCERDRRGQKNGRGFYDYDEKRNRTVSPEVQAIIADFAARSGEEQRAIGDDEILERLLYPMVNEGALILEEGMAQRASDIDVVWLNGYGWPSYTGGPMFWADQIGLDKVVEGLKRHQPHLSDTFRMSRLLADKAAAGEAFTA